MMARQSLKNIHRLIETATKQLPPEQSFVADLKMAIEKIDATSARETIEILQTILNVVYSEYVFSANRSTN